MSTTTKANTINIDPQILYEIIDAISSVNINEILNKVDTIVAEATKADSTGIYTLDDKTNSVILRASIIHSDLIGKLTMDMGFGITGWVAEHGETVVIGSNAASDSRFGRVASLVDDLFEAFLSVPIKNGEVVVGVINVKHKAPTYYSQETIQLIETIGKLVGKAIDYALLLEKTKDLEETIETQKLLTKAKNILIERQHITENEAYHSIRKQAMSKNQSMKAIAEAIITSSGLL